MPPRHPTARKTARKATRKTPKPPKRRRRSPDDARREILDAGEALVALRGPDGVGLKDVARAAGVSHALVTHYFGTYGALVSTILERRRVAAREEALRWMRDHAWKPGSGALLEVLLRLCSDETHVRLTTWAMLGAATPEARAGLVMSGGAGELRAVIDAMVAEFERRLGRRLSPALREEIDWHVMIAMCAAHGFALGRHGLMHATARTADQVTFAQFGERLRDLLTARIATAIANDVATD